MNSVFALLIVICLIGVVAKMLSDNRYSREIYGIHSNHRKKCAVCGCQITKENDSGWQIFVDSNTTQATRKVCNANLPKPTEIPR
jgi:hypothetical protein